VPTYNVALLALAQRNGEFAIDVQGYFSNKSDQFVDECHFTLTGHAEMAVFVTAELERHKKLR
jgi:hypothetical protein